MSSSKLIKNENRLREGFKNNKVPKHVLYKLKSEALFANLQLSPSPTIDWTNLEWHYLWVAVCQLFGCKPWLGCQNHQATKVWTTNQSKEVKCCQKWNVTKSEKWRVTKTEILLVASRAWKKTVIKPLTNSSFYLGPPKGPSFLVPTII